MFALPLCAVPLVLLLAGEPPHARTDRAPQPAARVLPTDAPPVPLDEPPLRPRTAPRRERGPDASQEQPPAPRRDRASERDRRREGERQGQREPRRGDGPQDQRGEPTRPAPPAEEIAIRGERPRREPPHVIPARLVLSVYQVELSEGAAAGLDSEALAEWESLADFEAALQKRGVARLFAGFDQVVNLRRARLSTSGAFPHVIGRSEDKGGRSIPAIARNDVGATIELNGAGDPGSENPGSIPFQLDIELAMIGKSDIELTDGVNAPVFRKITQSYAGMAAYDAPFVLISVDNSVPEAVGHATATITRVELRRP